MQFVKLNHWYLRDNQLSISLMKYYVDIEATLINNQVMAKLRVIDSNREELNLLFSSIESAVAFTENTINKNYSVSFDDIKEAYKEDSGKVFKKRREY